MDLKMKDQHVGYNFNFKLLYRTISHDITLNFFDKPGKKIGSAYTCMKPSGPLEIKFITIIF
jgi:hypothetical protein